MDRERARVQRVEDSERVMQMTGAAIEKTFADYDENLYGSRTDMSAEDYKDFLRDIQLQELQKDDGDALEVEMTEEEITHALQDLQLFLVDVDVEVCLSHFPFLVVSLNVASEVNLALTAHSDTSAKVSG
ncbi:hypothetical protein NDU88_010084 [Pleurodeles waltl]|uniref:Uncharacterized protein n=1 Tax=Pleurodeles waltl TaxID=8319 RepID=A0AAV7PTW3_PLEWA|nr:hypothetical protein NDU88_010084 [Pleurodeles waltl]